MSTALPANARPCRNRRRQERPGDGRAHDLANSYPVNLADGQAKWLKTANAKCR